MRLFRQSHWIETHLRGSPYLELFTGPASKRYTTALCRKPTSHSNIPFPAQSTFSIHSQILCFLLSTPTPTSQIFRFLFTPLTPSKSTRTNIPRPANNLCTNSTAPTIPLLCPHLSSPFSILFSPPIPRPLIRLSLIPQRLSTKPMLADSLSIPYILRRLLASTFLLFLKLLFGFVCIKV
jgi:hypothetical protein